MANYRLVMRSGPSIGKVFPLDLPEMFVGRDLNNSIVINDPEISRRHARFVRQGDSYVLEDLGSTNGTFIHHQRLSSPYILREGDMITFGEKINVAYELAPAAVGQTLIMDPEPPLQPAAGVQPPVQPAPVPVQPPPQPAPPPPSQPVYQAPAQYAPPPVQPVYAQNAYAEPVVTEEKPEPRSSGPLILLLIETILLILLCLFVVVTLYLIDANSAWCIFPIWPAGACP